MKTKLALSVLALLLVLGAGVASAPSVWAQVSNWFTLTFHDPNGSGASFGVAGPQPLKYQLWQPGYLPNVFSQGRTIAKFGEITEILYKNGDPFLILTETATTAGGSLPGGEAVTVNGQPAVLKQDLSGNYRELPEGVHPSDGGAVTVPAGSTDGEHVITQSVTVAPLIFNYTSATQLTFIKGNTQVELLSNLSVDEILKIAAGLVPADEK
jgi:hypothetical protein